MERLVLLVAPDTLDQLKKAMWARDTHSRSELIRQYITEGLARDAKKVAAANPKD